jgi:hypothetical protein
MGALLFGGYDVCLDNYMDMMAELDPYDFRYKGYMFCRLSS